MRRAGLVWALGLSAPIAMVTAIVGFAVTGHAGQFYGHEPATSAVMPLIGALLITRVRNPIGWLMLLPGVVEAYGAVAGALAEVTRSPHAGLLTRLGAWLSEWTWCPAFFLLFGVVPLLFPEGHLVSRRWLPALGAGAVGSLLLTVGIMLMPTFVDFPEVASPTPAAGASNVLTAIGAVSLVIGALAGFASSFARLRGGGAMRRAQIRWFHLALGVALVEVGFAVWSNAHSAVSELAQFLAVAGIPAAIGIAIVRYRLYDIDRLVSRTVSWALVTAVLVGVYAAVVTAVGAALPAHSSSYAVAVATLVAVALLQPLRRRLQGAVDRRFNRERYDAARTAAAFATRLRDEVDLVQVRADLVSTVAAAVAPAVASVWVRP